MKNDIIEKIVTEFEVVRKDFQSKAQTALKTCFTEFFNENPRIKSVYWTQYTPYFNDGEECCFSTHEMYAITQDAKEDDDEYIDDREGVLNSYSETDGYENESKNFQQFTRLVNKLPDEVFQDTFGDHCEVTATRSGFDVEEYQHD